MKTYYFGCHVNTGHYFWDVRGRMPLSTPGGCPWGLFIVDGGLQPKGDGQTYRQGAAALHRKEGWTALAWWDMSVDKRPASCSVLMVKGAHSFEEMLVKLKDLFPKVYEQQPKDIFLSASIT